MKLLENLSVLLVIPDLPSKTKLREVLRSVLYKSEVQYERGLKDLDKKLADPISTRYHLIFVSGRLPLQELSAFVKSTAALPSAKRPAVIVSLPSASSQDSGTIASLYLDGVSGFISDPYTSQDLSELLTKIMEQRAKNSPLEGDQKSRKASSFLLADAMALVDEVARLRFEGKEGGYPLRDLKALSKSFAEYYARDPEGYASTIVETFLKAKPASWAKGTSRTKVKSKVFKHPGVIVWELMAERGIVEDRLAALLRIDAASASALTRGNFAVDETLAHSLSRVFGMSPREWLRMQSDFDAYRAASTKEGKR